MAILKKSKAKPAAKTQKSAAKPAAKAKKPAAKPAPKPEPKKIGGEITVNGNKLMSTLQREFSDKFKYLTLCFIIDADRGKSVNVKGINTARKLADVRKKFSNKEISIHGATKVENLEKYFWEELGIACQIGICNYSGHKHYFPIGSFNVQTLRAADSWAKSVGCKKVGPTEISEICRGNIF